MDQLSYATLEKQGFDGYLLPKGTERVMQFGEGNFLRAFVDYFFDLANERNGIDNKVVVFQPIAPGRAKELNEQDGLYTVYLRGLQDGKEVVEKRVVSSISRVVNPYEDYEALLECARNPEIRFAVSNTTEAGIAYDPGSEFEQTPPVSFPAKVTRVLYERYTALGKENAPGLAFLSCELIDYNGDELKRCVNLYIDQWGLEDGFKTWVNEKNLFCSTMVDRIVTGYPAKEAAALNEANGYLDKNLDTGEIFAIWYIEGPDSLADELPFKKAGLPVVVCPDCRPFKQRKVRILNGVQTTLVLACHQAGNDIMRFALKDEDILAMAKKAVYEEILPTLPYSEDFQFTQEDLKEYSAIIFDRLHNPYIDHQLMAISLNTTAKWKARVMPSVLEYQKMFGKVPECLTLGFAAYLKFYHGYELRNGGLVNKRDGVEYIISDDKAVLEFYYEHRDDTLEQLADAVCSRADWWGMDMHDLPTFVETVKKYVAIIETEGMHAAIEAAAK